MIVKKINNKLIILIPAILFQLKYNTDNISLCDYKFQPMLTAVGVRKILPVINKKYVKNKLSFLNFIKYQIKTTIC